MTASESVVLRVADALEAGSVRYMLSGSFASNYYVATKLRWGRGKDKDDARDVTAVQARSLDWS